MRHNADLPLALSFGKSDLHYHGVDLLQAAAVRSGIGWRRLRRWWGHLGRVSAWTIVVLFAAVIAGVFVLTRGPVSVDGLQERVARALETKLGAGWRAQITDATLSWEGLGPSLTVGGLSLRDPAGTLVLTAPVASISIDSFAAITGDLRPRSVAFQGVDIRLSHRPDGSIGLGFDPGAEPGTQPVGETSNASTVSAPEFHEDIPSIDAAALGNTVGSMVALFTGENGPFGVLDRASLSKSRLLLTDRRRVERVAFEDISIDLERTGDATRKIGMSVRGRQGTWGISGLASGRNGEIRTASVNLANAALADLMLLVGQSAMPLVSDTTLSGELETSVAADGALTKFNAHLRLSAGSARIDLPGFARTDIRESAGNIVWNPQTQAFDVLVLGVDIGGLKAAMSGKVTPSQGDRPWQVDLAASGLALSSPDEGQPPYIYDNASISLRLPDHGSTLNGTILLERGETRIVGNIETGLSERSPHGLSLDVTGSRVNGREGLRLWPSHIAPEVRTYLMESLRSGMIEAVSISSRLSPREYQGTYFGEPMPDAGLKATFSLSSVEGVLSPGLPLLLDADVTGLITGRTARVTAKNARVQAGNRLSMGFSDGVFTVPDTTLPDPPARLTFQVAGGADAFVALLQSPAIRNTLNLELDAASLKGSALVKANVALRLGRPLEAPDFTVSANGQLSNVTLEQALGSEKLENANLALSFERNVLSLKGDARAFGQPATIDIKHQPKLGAGEATLSFSLDEAARIKRGLNFGPALTGSLPIRITAPLSRQPASRPRVEIDLTRNAIEGLVPGWSKPSGRAAKLSFAFVERTGAPILLDDLVLEGGNLLARGQATLLASDNSLDSLDLSMFKLSPGDDMKVKLERNAGVSKVTVRGAVIDARPFLKSLSNPAPSPSPSRRPGRAGSAAAVAADGPSFDLDLMTPILAGHNDEAITGVDLKISRRGSDVRQFRFTGKLGPAPFSAELTSRDSQPGLVVVRTGDGGGLLRFVDLYKRMIGGDLVMSLIPFEEPQSGAIDVREFALRNEPALRRIITEQPANAPTGDRVAGAATPPVNPNEVEFTRMKGSFIRSGGRTDVRDAVIWGPQVGLSVAGYIDSVRDRTDMAGTYVPAYGLNNIFSQVPVFGLLLGGGQYEGLFAVNFRISGLASAPTLTINPLSAVAPGIFRKFFEASRSSEPGTPVPALPER